MGEPEAAKNGCGEREAITLIRLVRNDDPIVRLSQRRSERTRR
jgi:hypothetical protein